MNPSPASPPSPALTAYDDIAYLGGAFAFAQPNRLAGAAQLFGHAPVDPSRCRVLEIGCGEGGNLVPMAFGSPQVQCVGVDLAPTAIAIAQRSIDALRLTNVTVLCMDLSALTSAQVGKFDYIIAHGVFSWVPDSVRSALLRVTSELLSAGGVAMISYNTLPGCRTRNLVRELLAYKQRGLPYEAARVPEARQLMGSLAALASQAERPHFKMLQKELNFALELSDHVLFHDDLAPHTKAFHLSDFVAMAQEHGLQFAGDADITDMFKFDAQLQPNAAIGEWIAAQAAGDWVAEQQYADFLFGTRFRRSLLRRAIQPSAPTEPAEPTLANDSTAPKSLDTTLPGLHFRSLLQASSQHPLPGLNDSGALHVHGANGLEAAITVPVLKHAIMQLLNGSANQTWSIASLERACRASMHMAGYVAAPGSAVADGLSSFIGQMVKVAGVQVYGKAVVATPPSQPPTLHALARARLQRGVTLIDAFQESMRLEGALTVYAALCLDGRSLADLAAHLGDLKASLGADDPRHAELQDMQTSDIPANVDALVQLLSARGQLRV